MKGTGNNEKINKFLNLKHQKKLTTEGKPAFGFGFFLAVILKLGLIGIWIDMALDEDIRAVIFFFRWKLGRWRYIRLSGD